MRDFGIIAVSLACMHPSICPSVEKASVINSSQNFQAVNLRLNRCYQPIEDVYVTFEEEKLIFDNNMAFLT